MRTLILLTILSGFFRVSGYAQNFTSVGFGFGLNYGYSGADYIGGVSFVDFDQDGRDDLTFTTGPGSLLQFYRNTETGFQAIDPLVDDISEVKQVLWVDFDNDADLDLYIAGSLNRLFRNNGNLNFEDITPGCGFTDPVGYMSFSALWTDFNHDALPDLFVSFRLTSSIGEVRFYTNNGDNTFSDNTSLIPSPELMPQVLACAAADVNNDSWEDLLIGQVYGNGTYVLLNQQGEQFLTRFVNDDLNSHNNTMSMSLCDFDADNDIDFYITDSGNGNSLEQNDGNGNFLDVAQTQGLLAPLPSWSAAFFDANNDTYSDMHLNLNYGSKSYRKPMGSIYQSTLWGMEYDDTYNVGLALGDIDQDGYPDMAKSSPTNNSLWINNNSGNHFLKINLRGITSNYFSIGAKISVYSYGVPQLEVVACGENYASQNTYTQFFGLGDQSYADSIIISWPSGIVRKLYNIPADQNLLINEIEPGCTNMMACNFNPMATVENNSCVFPADFYNCDGTCISDADGDLVCDPLEIPGCTDLLACNYSPLATDNDGSCIFPNSGFNCDGSCIHDSDNDGICDENEISGCTDANACNYLPSATDDNAQCTYALAGFDCNGNCLLDDDQDGICNPFEIPGCNDPDACNYNPLATDNDLTCSYLNYYTISGDTNPMDQIALTYAYTPIPGSFFNWTLSGGGDIVDGQGSPSITVVWNTPGAHTISVHEVTWMNCIGNDVSLNVNVIPNSISEQVLNALDVYPNPANDLITLNHHSGDHFMIYDQTGNIIQAGFISTSSFQIASHEWPAGLYTIRVDDDGIQKTARVLIIH